MRPVSRPMLLLRFTLLAALLGGLVVGVLGVRWVVDSRMAEIRASIMLFLQEKLGRNISFGRLSPSVFGQLDITDLKVYSKDDPDRVILSVSRLRASYSLMKLLLTRKPLEALKEINLSDSVLTFDWEADKELWDVLGKLARGDGTATPGKRLIGPSGLRVTGTELSLRLLSRQAVVGVSRLSFTLATTGTSLTVALRAGLVMDLDVPGPLAGHLETTVDVSGSTAPDLSRADLQVQVRSLVHDRIALRDQTFLVAYRDGTLTATKIEDRAPVDLELVVRIPEKSLTLTFRTDELAPRDLVSLRGEWQPFAGWLKEPVSSRGSLVMALDGGSLSYEMEVTTRLVDDRFPGPVALTARVRGDKTSLQVTGLEAILASGSVAFTGDLDLTSLLPRGTIRVEGFESLVGRRVSGSVAVDRSAESPGLLSIGAASLRLGVLELSGLVGTVDLAASLARVTAVAVAPATAPGGAEATAGLEGTLRWAPSISLDLHGTFVDVPILPMAAALLPGSERSIPGGFATYLLTADLSVTTDLETFAADVATMSLRDPVTPANRVDGSFYASNGVVDVRSLSAAYLGQRLSGSGRLDLAAGKPVGFHSTFSLNDVPFEVDGALDLADKLRFTGSYGIEGELMVFPSETSKPDVYFWIQSGEMPVPFAGLDATASLNLNGVFPDGDKWFLTSTGSTATLSLPPLKGATEPTKVQASLDFILDSAGVFIERIDIADRVSGVTGAGAVWFLDLAVPRVGLDLNLASLAAKVAGADTAVERYLVSGTVSPEEVDLTAEVTGAPVAHLGQSGLVGTVSGSIRLTGSPASPRVQGSAKLDYGRLNAEPLILATDVDISKDSLALSGLRLKLGNHDFTEGQASVDLTTGLFRADVRYAAELLRDQVATRMILSGVAPGYGVRELTALAFPDGLDAVLTVSEATVDTTPFPGWTVKVRAVGDALVFGGGPQGVLDGSLGRDGRLALSFRSPFPLVATLGGRIDQGKLALDLAVQKFDLATLDGLISSDIIHFTGGTASTPGRSTIRIQGPMNDPDFVGSLRLTGGSIRTPMSPDAAVPVDTWIHFGPSADPEGEAKEFVLDTVTAPMGKGRITAAARFTMDHWSPSAFELRLTAEPPTGVHLVWRFGTLVVDGYATGTVRVVHDGYRTLVSSTDLAVLNSKLQMDFSPPEDESEPEGEPAPMDVDLKIRTGRAVQFSWPAQTLPILKATARQGSEVHVIYDGDGGELVLTGDVGVLGGNVFFFDRSFSIRDGSISFRENALQFDPRVSLHAEIRERDAENRELRIFVDADRVRLSQLRTDTIRFSSDPPLSSPAILSRLGQSIFTRAETAGLDTSSGTSALPLIASLTGDLISQIGILSPIEDGVRDLLGLDLVSIRTQLVQNFLIDKALGSGLDNSSPALGKYFGNTELTVGKYIGDDLFLEMMVRLQTADTQQGIAGLTGLSPAFEISLEWETPFFTLDWSFLPRHPEDLFLSDNTLGLRWRYVVPPR